MDKTLVFLDEGFLDKLTKFFGKGIRLKFNKIDFAKKIALKQNLTCEHLFYYTAPPFQGVPPTEQEKRMRKGYDKFINALSKNKEITIREGRCQKIIDQNGEISYNQKGVDTLLTLDLSHVKKDFPETKEIILVSSDTDFCPVIKDIKKRGGIETILYSYFEKKRNSKFSVSNELFYCCSKFIQLSKEDFDNAPLTKDKEEVKR